MDYAICAEDVVFRYLEKGKRNILDHVNLTLKQGSFTVLMGASGSGKSTLAAVLCGLYPQNGGVLENGNITLFGQETSSLSPQHRAKYISMMFQNPDLQFCMDTLRQEMIFCMENICIPKEEMDERLLQTAKLFSMEQLLERKLHTLSGGEKQKAALCCLAVLDSKCIVLDEALANLDGDSAAPIVQMLKTLHRQGKTIVVIDHKPDRWMDAADEIIVLGEGAKVLARGINKDNLAQHESLFHANGLFYPAKRQEKANQNTANEACLVLQNVTIPHPASTKKTPLAPLIENASATFPKGCMTALLGKSGSGKTTLFLSILKQLPFEGHIILDGADIKKLKPSKVFSQIGVVFQNPGNQFITQNVLQEVSASLPSGDERAMELLESFSLAKYHRYSPYMLSQGQQRRLAVLSVLAGGQKVLFLDEPTYGQDAKSTNSIMQLLKEKMEQEELSVVFITHDEDLAHAWADKIYRLQDHTLSEVSHEA